MRKAAFVLFMVFASVCSAEAPAQQGAPQGAPQGGYGGGGGYYAPPPAPAPAPGRGIQVFDDRVFDLTPREAAAPTTSRGGRILDREPTYNSEQRQRWLDSCAPMREKDSGAYRECYANEKAKDTRALRQSYDEVERRQNQPGRNNIPLYEEGRRGSLGVE